jgi:ribosomal-protein-alanine N-acetyltransferase
MPYGYYDTAPYGCAPYGYYGPEWFTGGVFIGAGPWFHGPDNFQGHVNNRFHPDHGYKGPAPKVGDKPEPSKPSIRLPTSKEMKCVMGAAIQNLKRFDSPAHAGYWVLTEANELAGVININEIVGGSFRSGYLGYYAFAPHNGHGYMTAGIRAVVSRAFRTLRLHRLEANIQLDNEASRRLIQRLGFRLEGFSPRYLKIAGKWRDHERWALTAEEWKG